MPLYLSHNLCIIDQVLNQTYSGGLYGKNSNIISRGSPHGAKNGGRCFAAIELRNGRCPGDGQTALVKVGGKIYDLILMDIGLPDMDGLSSWGGQKLSVIPQLQKI